MATIGIVIVIIGMVTEDLVVVGTIVEIKVVDKVVMEVEVWVVNTCNVVGDAVVDKVTADGLVGGKVIGTVGIEVVACVTEVIKTVDKIDPIVIGKFEIVGKDAVVGIIDVLREGNVTETIVVAIVVCGAVVVPIIASVVDDVSIVSVFKFEDELVVIDTNSVVKVIGVFSEVDKVPETVEIVENKDSEGTEFKTVSVANDVAADELIGVEVIETIEIVEVTCGIEVIKKVVEMVPIVMGKFEIVLIEGNVTETIVVSMINCVTVAVSIVVEIISIVFNGSIVSVLKFVGELSVVDTNLVFKVIGVFSEDNVSETIEIVDDKVTADAEVGIVSVVDIPGTVSKSVVGFNVDWITPWFGTLTRLLGRVGVGTVTEKKNKFNMYVCHKSE